MPADLKVSDTEKLNCRNMKAQDISKVHMLNAWDNTDQYYSSWKLTIQFTLIRIFITYEGFRCINGVVLPLLLLME